MAYSTDVFIAFSPMSRLRNHACGTENTSAAVCITGSSWEFDSLVGSVCVEDCNVCRHKRRGTVTDMEQSAVKLYVNFKAVVMKHVGGTHIMKIWH